MSRIVLNDGRVSTSSGKRIAAACCPGQCDAAEDWIGADPITGDKDGTPPNVWQYNGTGYARAGMRVLCWRFLLYVGAYHNGTTYILPTPEVIGPWQSGSAIPNEYPWVTPCWDLYQYAFGPIMDPKYSTSGNSTTVSLSASFVFSALDGAACLPPAYRTHLVLAYVVQWGLYHRFNGYTGDLGNVQATVSSCYLPECSEDMTP